MYIHVIVWELCILSKSKRIIWIHLWVTIVTVTTIVFSLDKRKGSSYSVQGHVIFIDSTN